MSKRRGDVVFLDDFIDEIGIDAARWYLVSRGHDQTIEIDIDLAAEKSAKNPVFYVQYAHARIAGILRNAPAQRPCVTNGLTTVGALAAEERDLVKRIARVPRGRRRGDGAPRAARDPDLRDPARRRLPPLLPPPQGARLAAAELPARPLHRDEDGDRPLPRPDRGRGAGQHVSAPPPERADALEPRARRARDRLGADRSPRGRRRRSTRPRSRSGGSGSAALTLAVVALVGGQAPPAPPGAAPADADRARRRPGRALVALLRGGQARLRRARRAHVLLRADLPRRAGAALPAREALERRPRRPRPGRDRHRARRARGRGRPRVRLGRARLRDRVGADVRGARDPLQAAAPRGRRAADGGVLGLPRGRDRARAGAPLRRATSCPTTPASGRPCSCSASSSPGSRPSPTRRSCAT